MFILSRVVAIVLLLIASLSGRESGLRYSYFTLLRWVVCAVAAYGAVKSHEMTRQRRSQVFTSMVWAFAIMAVLFNPLVPIHLDRDLWRLLDLCAAALLILSLLMLRNHSPINDHT